MTRRPRRAARSRVLRTVGPFVIAGGAVVGALTPATAFATVTGGCQGSGTINGTTYQAAALDPASPIEIPTEGDVTYHGSVPLPAGPERSYSGHITLNLPLGSVTVVDWAGTTKTVDKSGSYHYSLPSFMPKGITVTGSGTHTQDGMSAPCTGEFAIKLPGSPMSSPTTYVALGGTGLSAFALLFAAFKAGIFKGVAL